MLCQFERLLYPKDARYIDPGSYMIALYKPCEQIRDLAGNRMTQIKAVGFCLPISGNVRYDMQGKWTKNAKFGLQFEMENYSEVVVPNKENIVAYLSSGQIKGIGPAIAERIYAMFGNDALEVLDKEPEKLLSISGISEGKLKRIRDSYLANRSARDIVAFLAPHGITPNRAVRIYREYGDRAMQTVQEHPYRLCEMAGVGFRTADKIAMQMGFDALSTERVDEGLQYTLADAEGKGHLCMEKHAFIKACMKLLDTPELTEEMVANRALRLVHAGTLICYQGNVYRARAARAEEHLSTMIARQLRRSVERKYPDLEAELDAEENRLKLKLAAEQREAVKTALTNGISIITGGPGTGKTMIQRAILDLFHRNHPNAVVCACAPTGRAARRMAESTGYPASTVHKALGLFAGEDGDYNAPNELEADLVLVDESSMLDIYLACHLFDALRPDAQIIFVGDADQLPSVGPGAVLGEMIGSGCIPTVRLDKVFRQNAGSRIAINAKLIRHGNVGLEYGEDFSFLDSPEIAESAGKIVDLYLRETARFGVDNVVLLSPYRQKTETGVNALNELLREKVNPPDRTKPEVVCGKRVFRLGDKVMQTRNCEDINNGDIGYIRKILSSGDDPTAYIDFGDGRVKEYDRQDMEMLDLGYASTIHKSQGSEYQSVIVNLQMAHSVMLTRPLIYTAITRGKQKVTVIGERRALCIAIKRLDTEKRGTCLALRLQESK